MCQRKAQDLPSWRVFAGEQIKRRIWSRFDGHDSVCKMCDLGPVSGCVHHIVRELATIAVGHGGNQPMAIIAGVQLNLGNPRKVLTGNVDVLPGIGAEAVKINLLVEIGVSRAAVRCPGDSECNKSQNCRLSIQRFRRRWRS